MAAPPRSARFAYEVARNALMEQLARIDSLDQKAGIILAAGGIVGGLVLTPDDLSTFPTWLAILIVVTLVASLLGALIALASRRYELAPTPERIASLAGADEDRLRWMFIGNLLEAVDVNRENLRTKSRWLATSQFALFATVFQLGAYSVWHEVKG